MADGETTIERSVLTTVPHVQQRFSWDCGLACAQMVLRFLGVHFPDFESLCNRLDFGTSVWTIDLAHIMAHYGISHHYATTTLGVDEGYSNKSFYKSNFSKDEARVNDLFRSPDCLGIALSKRTVSFDDIKRHLSVGNVAIFLVDWSRLDCKWCHSRCLTGVMKCFSAYQGHYIVVVGYDEDNKTVLYKNPSYKEELCCCSMKTFDIARKSYGTDQDILFVYKADIPARMEFGIGDHS